MSTFKFAKPSELTGGTFFKPADYMNALALMIKPKSIDQGKTHTYRGQTTVRDEVTADVTVFPTEESLDKGTPIVIKNAIFTHGMLTSTLAKVLENDGAGGVMVGVIRKVPTRAGQGYVFRDVDESTAAKVANYYLNREARIKEGLANVPDFED